MKLQVRPNCLDGCFDVLQANKPIMSGFDVSGSKLSELLHSIMAASTSVIERVQCALTSKDENLLRQILRELTGKLQSCAVLPDQEHIAKIGKTLYRHFGAEIYIPKYVKLRKSKSTAVR